MASNRETGQLGWATRAWCAVVVTLLLAPTAVVIPMSFSDATTFKFPPEDWSLRWYRNLFSSPEWFGAMLNSLQIGLIVAVIATALGTCAAIALSRSSSRLAGVVRQLMLAPMIVPSIVVAIAIYSVFLGWRLSGTMLAFVLAHTVLAVPFVVTVVLAGLVSFDRSVEMASASLGATAFTTFRRITLPILAPAVLSGFVFAFVTSLDEVVVSLFLKGPEVTTLPVQMYESVTLEVDPTIGAASSVILVGTTLLLLIPLLPRRRGRSNSEVSS